MASAILLSNLLLNSSFADETKIYQSVSEDGTVVFSDDPSSGAKTLAPAPLNVIDTSEIRTPRKKPEFPEKKTSNDVVKFVKLLNPLNDQTFINQNSPISVTITTGHRNGLPRGHTSQILLNGSVVTSGTWLNYSIPMPPRGTHSINAKVFDSSGKLRARSNTVSINVIKTTVKR